MNMDIAVEPEINEKKRKKRESKKMKEDSTNTAETPVKIRKNNKMISLNALLYSPNGSSSLIPELPKRKTKGAKVIESLIPSLILPTTKANNIILHLKCSLKDIDEYIQQNRLKFKNILSYDPNAPGDIVAYENNSHFQHNFQPSVFTNSSSNQESRTDPNLNSVTESNIHADMPLITNLTTTNATLCCCKCGNSESNANPNKSSSENPETEDPFTESDFQKLKQLKIMLYRNEMKDKTADCFWCTCPFDNDPCYILQYGYNNEIYGHGSFCSPECSVAFLFSKQQGWDDSAKTESYQLINYYYGKPNSFQQSIKPALSPYYFLDKYYGNLTIQEYRRLNKSQHMMLVVDKPVTRILPEIHEDNDSLFVGSSYANSGKYKVRKQSEKPAGVSRNTILREKFGLSAKE